MRIRFLNTIFQPQTTVYFLVLLRRLLIAVSVNSPAPQAQTYCNSYHYTRKADGNNT